MQCNNNFFFFKKASVFKKWLIDSLLYQELAFDKYDKSLLTTFWVLDAVLNP